MVQWDHKWLFMDSAYTWHHCRVIAGFYQSRGTRKLKNHNSWYYYWSDQKLQFFFKGIVLVRQTNTNQLHAWPKRSIDLLYVSIILHLLHGVGANCHFHVDSIVSFHQSNYTVRHHSDALRCQRSYSWHCYWLRRLNHLQTVQVWL